MVIQQVCVGMLSSDGREGLWDGWRTAPVLKRLSPTDRRCFGCDDGLSCRMSTVMLVSMSKTISTVYTCFIDT